jgi:hypothetical protein
VALRAHLLAHGTPQTQGRVERANQTLRDRMVREMRLRNIDLMETGNGFSPTCIILWNEMFAVLPRDETSAHRPWTGMPAALDDTLARHEERVLSEALTFGSTGTKYCVRTSGPGTAPQKGSKLQRDTGVPGIIGQRVDPAVVVNAIASRRRPLT